MKAVTTIKLGNEFEPDRMHYILANDSGSLDIASAIIDPAIPRPAAIKLAKRELIERAQYVLLRESESVRMGVEDYE